MTKITRIFNTVRYLKVKQIGYQIWYRAKRKLSIPNRSYFKNASGYLPKVVCDFPPNRTSFVKNSFDFLNITVDFQSDIDWNYPANGKLWTYNLNYFDFLNQKNISKQEGLSLIENFCSHYDSLKDGVEPFPTSLRIVNWIKFIIRCKVEDEKIDSFLLKDINNLCNHLEYQILGNHLLENAFALFFAAQYFQNEKLQQQTADLLTAELKEQVLKDGGHFEKSPMYHNLMLHKVLDCINLSRENLFAQPMTSTLTSYAEKMLGWASTIMFANGDLPKVNDSTIDIALSTTDLLTYAKALGVKAKKIPLGDSGYRKFQGADFELLVDVGTIGPDYIPSHAHSDTLSFLLYMNGRPMIVDPGISTYEKNKRRNWERSTAAHNTVQVDGLEQTEVWGGFRVAKRAMPTIVKDETDCLTASHNGYQSIGVVHTRSFEWQDKGFVVTDQLEDAGKRSQIARLFFHPDTKPQLSNSGITIGELRIDFEGAINIELNDYQYAEGFNTLLPAKCLAISFSDTLITRIFKN